jgi:hypothetical protein
MWEPGEGNGFGLRRRFAWLCALCLAAVAVGTLGCGGQARSPVAVRVGDSAISEATVAHWARVIATGNRVEGFAAGGQGEPRQRALELLIAAAWLRGEAHALGIAPSSRAVDDALEQRREANGAAEFEQGLRAAGQTIDDVRLEVEAKLAAAAIRREVFARVPAVSDAEVLAYYRAHRAQFRVPGKRTVDLLEGLPSRAAARAIVGRIGIGARFTQRAFHEVLQPPSGARTEPDIERVTRAIFAAGVGVPSRPLRLNGHWTVFVVRKVVPTSFRSPRAVRGEIVMRLGARRREQALAAFSGSFSARWAARTRCHTGYVVPGCAQYAGAARPRLDPLMNETPRA